MFGWRRSDDEGESEGGGKNGGKGEVDRNVDFAAARARMVDALDHRIDDPATAAALRAVPRHAFVPEPRQSAAYQDRPLPIGCGQTISAPHMVAEMLDRLALSPGETVLEIGTGCGYHAAVTAEVVGAENVFSVEFHDALAREARDRLADLGYGAISIRIGDGHGGWPAHEPYDAAYLTCAPTEFPPAVVEQVGTGGRLIGPLGRGQQRLVLARKRPTGLETDRLGAVRFVPMRGDA